MNSPSVLLFSLCLCVSVVSSSILQAEELAQGVEQGVALGGGGGLFGQGRDGAVQKAVLEEPKGAFDVAAVGVGQPAVEAAQQLPDDLAALGVGVLRQP